jgi:hypothetical protein
MKVYIVGEDPVTCAIIERVLAYCSDQFEIISTLPARGGQIKSKIKEFNALSAKFPVILLTDLDSTQCAPLLCKEWMPENKHERFIFNVAIDEGEAWLMADRNGFAEYIAVNVEEIPLSHQTKQGGMKALNEMNFPYKSSLYLTHNLLSISRKQELIKQLRPKTGATKGPEYNSGILPFIQNQWNIEQAKENSDSLNRMIMRINSLLLAQPAP